MATDLTALGGPRVVPCIDRETGLDAVIVVDDTTLGPGLGGVRLKPYPTRAAAVREGRRLAAGMTRKNAVAEVPYGGAKAVIRLHPAIPDRAALMRRFGDFVAALGGDYLPGVDMGTTGEDMASIGEAGCAVSCSLQDPSPWTAAGVHASIRAAVGHVEGRHDLRGVRVVVQGAGHVGGVLSELLVRDGAEILIADIDPFRADALARDLGASTLDPAEVIGTACDVFAPCAAAGVLDAEAIARLDCRVVAGAANDTLADPGCADLLARRGIAYVPDFVANAGGVIHIHALRAGWDDARLAEAVLRIGGRAGEVLQEADGGGATPLAVAEAMAARRLAAARPDAVLAS